MTPPSPAPDGRAPEIEGASNRWLIHPLARRITPVLARAGVHPNAVSLAGMASGIAAGIAYVGFADRRRVALGLLLMLLWHLADGIDGQLARLTRKFSPIGTVLDGVCDYVTFTAVYAALALALLARGRSGALVLAALGLAAISHVAQAAAYEAQRQDYDGFGRGRGTPTGLAPARATRRVGGTPLVRVADGLHRLYVALQRLTIGARAVDRVRLAAVLAGRPEHADAIRGRYRTAFAPALRRWSLLSANSHTVLIAAFAFARVPLGYFAFEITALNALLLVLLVDQRRRVASFVAGIEPAPLNRPRAGAAAAGAPARSPGWAEGAP